MLRAIAVLGLFSVAICSQSAPLQESSSSALFGNLLPGFYNGYLFYCQPSHVLTLFAPDGRLILTLPIQGHGNGDAQILSVAIESDTTLAIAWIDFPNAGIDIRDFYGNVIRTIDTGRYIPSHLAFGEDHSLWSLGWQRKASTKTSVADRQDYSILRKYSPDGKEIGAYLPRSLFPAGLEPGMDQWQIRQITVTGDRVGIEAISGSVGNQREWVELDLDGNLKGRWRLDPTDEFIGVAFTADNQAYVQRRDREAKVYRVLKLNRATSAWEPVDASNVTLYGSDGDKLVFAHWSDGIMYLNWNSQPQHSL